MAKKQTKVAKKSQVEEIAVENPAVVQDTEVDEEAVIDVVVNGENFRVTTTPNLKKKPNLKGSGNMMESGYDRTPVILHGSGALRSASVYSTV